MWYQHDYVYVQKQMFSDTETEKKEECQAQ